jgi:hypothetical protein
MRTRIEASTAHKMFREWTEAQPSQRAAAKQLRLSVGYVNDMYHERRRLTAGALRKIGVLRREVYERR